MNPIALPPVGHLALALAQNERPAESSPIPETTITIDLAALEEFTLLELAAEAGRKIDGGTLNESTRFAARRLERDCRAELTRRHRG